MLFLPVVVAAVEAPEGIKYCVKAVRDEVARTDKGEILLNYFSQADLTQRVVGPLRRNRLTSAQADEIRALSDDKQKAFYELVTKDGAAMRSRLLVVDRSTCKIVRTYAL